MADLRVADTDFVRVAVDQNQVAAIRTHCSDQIQQVVADRNHYSDQIQPAVVDQNQFESIQNQQVAVDQSHRSDRILFVAVQIQPVVAVDTDFVQIHCSDQIQSVDQIRFVAD